MRHHRPTTKRIFSHAAPPDTSIRDLPLGVHKIPPNEWRLRLRRYDGTWETRSVRGDIHEARAYRDVVLAEGPYSEAWLSEGREQRMRKPRPPAKEPRAETMTLGWVLDAEPYYTPNDF